MIIIGGCNNLLCIELTIYSGIALYRVPLGQHKGDVLISGVYSLMQFHACIAGTMGGGGCPHFRGSFIQFHA